MKEARERRGHDPGVKSRDMASGMVLRGMGRVFEVRIDGGRARETRRYCRATMFLYKTVQIKALSVRRVGFVWSEGLQDLRRNELVR